MQAHGFRNYFTPLVGVLFTFPSRYSCAIGLTGVFSLAGWSRRIRTGFLVPRATQDTTTAAVCFGYGAVTRCGATFQTLLLASTVRRRGPTTPGERLRTVPGLGWSPFARHYWGNHCCFLFLEVLRCFSSLRSPPHPMVRVTALQAAGLSHSETRGS